MLFFMFAAVITVSWGLFNNKHAAAAAILLWGVGDATAALVGIPFGKHKVIIKPVNGKKSWEGSCAMLLVSAFTGIVQSDSLYHSLCNDPALNPVLNQCTVFCIPKTSPHRCLHMFHGNDAGGKKLAVGSIDFCDHSSCGLSAVVAF